LSQRVILVTGKTEVKVGSQALRVLVADSTPLTGRLIADALARDRKLSVTNAEAKSVPVIASALQPHVTILSESLEGTSGRGFEVLTELLAAAPQTRVIILIDSAKRELVVEAFRRGARGVYCRSDPFAMLTRCVHRVHEGQLWISGEQLEFLLETLAQAPATKIVDTQGANLLSKREQEVVRWLAEGNTNREIARKLNISANTVKNYLFQVFNKLGVSSRVEVVIYAASQKNGGQSPRKDGAMATKRQKLRA
jgi:two-component system, NarL family, nitrate/nitrite response regulator NarL